MDGSGCILNESKKVCTNIYVIVVRIQVVSSVGEKLESGCSSITVTRWTAVASVAASSS